MTTTTITRSQQRQDLESDSSVKLTIVGRSAPYLARKTQASATSTSKPKLDRNNAGLAAEIDVEHSYSVMIPHQPLKVRFAKQRLAAALRALAGVVLGMGVGGYLATEVSTSHPLHINVASAASVYFLIGLALIPLTYRELFGQLTVDSFGIRVAAGVFGFSIPWDELDRWNVDGAAFRFRSRKSGVTESVRIDHLSSVDRQLLLRTLKSCAGACEQKKVYEPRPGVEVA